MLNTKRLRRIISVFLSVSYGVGAVATAVLEYRNHLFSERFDFQPEFLFVVFGIQLLCAIGVLISRYTRLAAICLTFTSVGAIYAHLKIGSPSTSVTAIAFSVIQIWLWFIAGKESDTSNEQ